MGLAQAESSFGLPEDLQQENLVAVCNQGELAASVGGLFFVSTVVVVVVVVIVVVEDTERNPAGGTVCATRRFVPSPCSYTCRTLSQLKRIVVGWRAVLIKAVPPGQQ